MFINLLYQSCPNENAEVPIVMIHVVFFDKHVFVRTLVNQNNARIGIYIM